MLALTEERVGLISCRILNVVMEVGELPMDEQELQSSINVDVNIISEAESEKPAGVDLLTYLRLDDGSVFSLDISARVIFDIPEDFSTEDAFDYLSAFGATRAFDCIRPYIEQFSTAAGFAMLDVPPVVVGRD